MTIPREMTGRELEALAGQEANGCPDCGFVSCICLEERDQDDGLDECGNPLFECPAFMSGGKLHCPLAGTEDCDWECDR